MSANKWILPALGFVLVTGVLGITIKLALRHVKWPELLLWAALVYAALAVVSLFLGNKTIHLGAGGAWGLASGICAASGLIFSFVALRHAPAVVAVPVMSAYPVVTVIGSLIFLGESFSASKAVGAALVLTGVVLLAR